MDREELLTKLREKEFPKSSNEKWHQQERNLTKREIQEILRISLGELDFEVLELEKGFGLILENDELGSIPIILEVVMKPMEYDLYEESETYLHYKEKERKIKEENERRIKEKQRMKKALKG